jgi:DNA-binding GntR family transcriptional regulator
MSQAVRPFLTKTEWVYAQMKQRILDGSFGPDDRLRLTELAREFQTSEMPVREALRMLHRDGLIVMHSHRGAIVASLSWAKAAEIVVVRTHLEVLAAREAAPHHDAASLQLLHQHVEQMDAAAAAGHAAGFSEANRLFHRVLYAPGPNAVLKEEIEDLWDRVWRTRSQSIFGLVPQRMAEAQAEHRAIVEAVGRRDADATAAAMASHRQATLAGWDRIIRDASHRPA